MIGADFASARRERFERTDIRSGLTVCADSLQADVSSACLEVRIDTVTNFILVTPRHDRVDQPLAAAVGELRVLPPERSQIVSIVWQPRNVITHKPAGGRSRIARVAFENYRLFDADPGVRTDLRAY